jgi:hypothetical protein
LRRPGAAVTSAFATPAASNSTITAAIARPCMATEYHHRTRAIVT